MGKITRTQHKFNAGEWSPRMYARSDIEDFYAATQTATNWFPYPQGPARKRNGTQYIAGVKTNSNKVRLIPFVASSSEAYVLEFGNAYIRFYTDGAQVVSGSAVEVSTPYSTSDVAELQVVQFENKLYIAHKDYSPRVLTFTSSTSWSLSTVTDAVPKKEIDGDTLSATLTPAATTGNGIDFTAGSAIWEEGDVGRTITNLSGNGKATITSYTSTTVVVCDITEDFPSTSAIASGDWRLDGSPVAGVYITSGSDFKTVGSIISIISTESDDGSTTLHAFRSDDVGKVIQFRGGSAEVTALESANKIRAQVISPFSARAFTDNWFWAEDIWNNTDGYPIAVGFFQQRLIFAGNTTNPLRIWGSKVGDFTNFIVGDDDDEALEFDLSTSTSSEIKWIKDSRDLVVGTATAEFTISGSGVNGVLTPTGIRAIRRTSFGSINHIPAALSNELVFIDASARAVRSFFYNFNIDGYDTRELTWASEHIADTDLTRISWAEHPNKLIYAVTSGGDLLAGVYDKSRQTIGWTRFTFTNGEVEDVAVIRVNEKDEIWVEVKRTVDGSAVRYIERFDSGSGVDWLDSFMDSSVTYSAPKTISGITSANPAVITSTSHGFSDGDTVKLIDIVGMEELNNRTFTVANKTTNTFELSGEDSSSYTTYVSGGEAHETVSSLSGLDHLEGEEVMIKLDGASHASKTVSGGSVTLDRAGIEAVVGLSYTMTLKTMHPEYGNPGSSFQTYPSRRVNTTVRLYQSALPQVNGTTEPTRKDSFEMDEANPLFTGDTYYGRISWDQGATVTITDTSQFPITISAIFGQVEVNPR